MKHEFFLRLTVYFLFPAFLTGCMQILMPQRGTLMGSTGEGSVGTAWWTGNKCQAILDWIEIFKKEYPQTDLTFAPTRYPKISQVAILFRDSSFVPVFGFSYNNYNAGKLYTINQKVIASCMGWGQHRNDYYKDLFSPFKTFFDNTFAQTNPYLVELARRLTEQEQQSETTVLKETSSTPLPAETSEPPREEKTHEQVREETTKEKEGALDIKTRVAERVGALDTIPLTLEGRQLSKEWMINFDRDFPLNDGHKVAIQARWTWLRHREKIFEATKDDFLARLEKIPTGPGSESAHERLLQETFPIPSDKTMKIYHEYLAATKNREKPFFKRIFDGAVDGVKKAGEAISEAARKTVHGSEDAPSH